MLFQRHFTNQFHCCFFTLVYPEPEGLPESSSGSETRQKGCQNSLPVHCISKISFTAPAAAAKTKGRLSNDVCNFPF